MLGGDRIFLKSTQEDFTDEQFKNIIEPEHDRVFRYIDEYIFPDVAAYYIATSYYHSAETETSLYNFINSTKFFLGDYRFKNYKKTAKRVKEILKIKYNLITISEDPLDFKNEKNI